MNLRSVVSSVWLASFALGCAGQDDEHAACLDEVPCLDEVGVMCTVAGTGEQGDGGDGGPALEASFTLPLDIAFGPDGTAVVVDFGNHRIRAIRPDGGIITTVAGSGESPIAGCDEDPSDPLGLCLNYPAGVAFDRDGQLVIAGWMSSRVHRIDLAGQTVSEIDGTGRRAYEGEGGPAAVASFDLPSSVAPDSDGGYYVMDQQNQVIRYRDEGGLIERHAGRCIVDRSWDGIALCEPDEQPVACPGSDKVTCGDPAETCAQPCTADFAGGGRHRLRMAQVYGGPATPSGHLALAPDGTLYFSDPLNYRVRFLPPDGAVSTAAGSGEPGHGGDGGPATTAELTAPGDLALAPDGTLYIADAAANCIRRVAPDGIIDAVVGLCGQERGLVEDGYPAEVARMRGPYGIALDGPILYIADTGNHLVRAVRLE